MTLYANAPRLYSVVAKDLAHVGPLEERVPDQEQRRSPRVGAAEATIPGLPGCVTVS